MTCPPTLRCLAFVAPFWIAACSAPTAAGPADGSGPPLGSAKPESAASAPPPPAVASAAVLPQAPTASASVAPAASAPEAASASAAPEAPLPAVKVSNIGMHIGGGPNDDPTKEPIRRSVEPHFDAFRRCFAMAEDSKKGGTFGIDLRIDKAGGKAKVSHPRTPLKGKDFEACVVRGFEAIDFLKPKGGTTVVSYSLRFTP